MKIVWPTNIARMGFRKFVLVARNRKLGGGGGGMGAGGGGGEKKKKAIVLCALNNWRDTLAIKAQILRESF